jgi:molecular chaperone DnaK
MKIIGIDLGTTNSCASIVEHGHPKVIPSSQGYLTIPSVVAFTPDDKLLVGYDAVRQSLTNPENTIQGSKRLLGRQYKDWVVQKVKQSFYYEITEGKFGEVEVLGNQRPFAVPEISALILRYIRKVAEEYLKEQDIKAVITVPAHFNDRQRSAVRKAGKIAGLEVVRIINEPTAATLAYGYKKEQSKNLVIYDLGGGTFDVTVMHVEGKVYQVLSTVGDTFLGGIDFDNRIVEYLSEKFERETKISLADNRIALQRLRIAAEEAKKELSIRKEAEIKLPFICSGPSGPLNLEYKLKREELELLTEKLVDKTLDICRSALEIAKLSPDKIDDIVLVGGQTRMPMVWEKLKALFGKSPSKGVHPDEAVAIGAAIMADIITRGETGVLLLDVVPLSIGLGLPDGRFKEIIPKNTTQPVKKKMVFTTHKDNQTSVQLKVMQGDSAWAKDNELLSKIALTGLPPKPKGEVKVEVTFSVDTEGILTVSALDKSTGKEVKTQISSREE